jgi:hypothetical protein
LQTLGGEQGVQARLCDCRWGRLWATQQAQAKTRAQSMPFDTQSAKKTHSRADFPYNFLYFQQKQTTATSQLLHERGFSFFPLNKAKRETEDTLTTLKRTPETRHKKIRGKKQITAQNRRNI